MRRPALLLALVPALCACRAERVLRLTSDPPGATVWVDDRMQGTTPLDLEFQHYGVRRVTYRMPGHGTASLRVEVEPPWFARFPIDIVSEVLLPFGWSDVHTVHAVLISGESGLSLPTLRSVLDRAEALRRAGPRGPGSLPPVISEDVAEPAEDGAGPR